MRDCLVCCWSVVLGNSLSHQIPTLGLWFAGGVVCVPYLGLPVCLRGPLAYLDVEALVSPPRRETGAGIANCFLIYSVVFLFGCIFQLSCHSFVVLSALPLFYSSLLFRLSFMGSDEESFSSLPSCPKIQ
jgi:hypothetical protein